MPAVSYGDWEMSLRLTFGYAHRGRPISVDFHSTPQIYSAIFTNEYDGAPDSNHPVGLGKTEEAAVAALIEQDEERQ